MNLLRREKKTKKKTGRTPDVAELTIYTDRPLMTEADKEDGGYIAHPGETGEGTAAVIEETDPITELFGK